MLFKISISFFYTQKVAYFVFKDSSSPVKARTFNPLKPDLLTLNRRPHPIKIWPTYAVPPTTTLYPPLNIRPVESGVIPDHFSTAWKTYPAHHDLSERARPIPAVFLTNIRSLRSRPAHCRSVHFSRAGESGGWSGLWCERALKHAF